MTEEIYQTVGELGLRRDVGDFHFLITEYERPSRAPRHAHSPASFTFVLEGGYEEHVAGLPSEHHAGALLYKPPGEPHSNRFSTPAATLLIQFPGRSSVLESFDQPILERPFTLDAPRVAALGLRLRRELDPSEAGDPCTDLSLLCWTFELLGHVSSRVRPGRMGMRSVSALARDWLHAHYRTTLDLVSMAREIGVTAAYLARSFRADFGCTAGQYQRQLRVAQALTQLARDDASIAGVAQDAGFVDQSHLNRVFRRHVGLTPGGYRRVVRARR